VIRVERAPEPADFHEKVRRPGLDAIAELVGETPLRKRPGPKRVKVADLPAAIPATAFPEFWREALPDLLIAYRRICAYSCLYIEELTGNASIDHLVPKSHSWELVYEWSNYRLASGRLNGWKADVSTILDPFEIEDGWFQLELYGYQVLPAPDLDAELIAKIDHTIAALRLNHPECLRVRERYVDCYRNADNSLRYVEARAPFVARELRRQGQLRDGDR
jgi:hypothetical protein